MTPIFNELAASALESMIPLMNARKLNAIAAFFAKFISPSNFFLLKSRTNCMSLKSFGQVGH
jgi:hypothetical protein